MDTPDSTPSLSLLPSSSACASRSSRRGLKWDILRAAHVLTTTMRGRSYRAQRFWMFCSRYGLTPTGGFKRTYREVAQPFGLTRQAAQSRMARMIAEASRHRGTVYGFDRIRLALQAGDLPALLDALDGIPFFMAVRFYREIHGLTLDPEWATGALSYDHLFALSRALMREEDRQGIAYLPRAVVRAQLPDSSLVPDLMAQLRDPDLLLKVHLPRRAKTLRSFVEIAPGWYLTCNRSHARNRLFNITRKLLHSARILGRDGVPLPALGRAAARARLDLAPREVCVAALRYMGFTVENDLIRHAAEISALTPSESILLHALRDKASIPSSQARDLLLHAGLSMPLINKTLQSSVVIWLHDHWVDAVVTLL